LGTQHDTLQQEVTLSMKRNSSIKKSVARIAENIFNVRIFRVLPRGVDPFYDLERSIPNWYPSTIFDVGANEGQSALIYGSRFPQSKIYSFEPAAAIFEQLKNCTQQFSNISCLNLALDESSGVGALAIDKNSTLSRLREIPEWSKESSCEGVEAVKKLTLDDFSAESGINTIDYLKIDTEGNDLRVLRGGKRLLDNARISVIEVEAAIGIDNDVHVPLSDLETYLRTYKYKIFGFYEQTPEWKRKLPHLRRVNAVFIRDDFVDGRLA